MSMLSTLMMCCMYGGQDGVAGAVKGECTVTHWEFWPWAIFPAWGFPRWVSGKESACNAGDLGLIPGSRRSPGEGKGYPLQYSGLDVGNMLSTGLYYGLECFENNGHCTKEDIMIQENENGLQCFDKNDHCTACLTGKCPVELEW